MPVHSNRRSAVKNCLIRADILTDALGALSAGSARPIHATRIRVRHADLEMRRVAIDAALVRLRAMDFADAFAILAGRRGGAIATRPIKAAVVIFLTTAKQLIFRGVAIGLALFTFIKAKTARLTCGIIANLILYAVGI